MRARGVQLGESGLAMCLSLLRLAVTKSRLRSLSSWKVCTYCSQFEVDLACPEHG